MNALQPHTAMRARRRTVLSVVLLALLTWPNMPLAAQDAPAPVAPVTLADTEVHRLRSSNVGDAFELWIARPQAGFAPSSGEPPAVLYVLDANLFFGTAVEMTRLMHKLYGELPALLVVGVAYPTENGLVQSALRTRDFTPSVDGRFAEMASSMPPLPDGITVEPAMGGANAFLRFLRDEVEPFVGSRFDVAESRTILFGSSLGGLFVTHALLTAPDAFDDYVAVSPALWWNGDEPFEIEERTRTERAGTPARAYVAVGALEETPAIPSLAPFRMVTNARRMTELLKEASEGDYEVHFVELEGETHTSVVPGALTRALRTLLGPRR
jgi:uncharacterized protein